MIEPIVWAVVRRQACEEARLASNLNLVLVKATTPEEARDKATKANRFGETAYMDPKLYVVVSLATLFDDGGDALLIRGDLSQPFMWRGDKPSWVF